MVTAERYERWRLAAVTIWAVIGGLLLAAVAFWGIGRIAGALVPFVIAFLLVFLLNALVRELHRRGVPRGIAAAVAIILGLVIIGAALNFIVPLIGRQLGALVIAAPQILQRIDAVATGVQQRYSDIVYPQWFGRIITAAAAPLSANVVVMGDRAAHLLVTAGSGLARGFFDFVLALIIAFWALRDLPKLRSEVIALAGPRFEADAEHLIRTVTRVVGGYLRGQSIASLTTGTLTAIGLSIIGVPYALLIGAIGAVFNFVPYVGPFITGVIAGVVGLFQSPLTGALAVVVVIVAQNVTDTLVAPRVMSDQVDLHPTLVIFSLLVGGALYGIPGMLFAIPVAATGKGLFVYYFERRTRRQLSTTDGALFRGTSSTRLQDERDEGEGIP